MVTWVGDGLVSGYDPTTKKHKAGVFHLATPGVAVDVNGGTRLHWDLDSDYPSRSSYPTKVQISATMTFSPADFAATPTRDLGMAAILVKASRFTAGTTPTPQQIFDATVDAYSVGSRYAEEGQPGPKTITASMSFTNTQLEPNTKYWLLVYPANIYNPEGTWSKTHWDPIGALNTNARAISIWTNRTPAAPTITSPLNGSIVETGDTFTLTFNPNDPDELTPNDGARSNADLAGVEVQYAALPTVSNPTPEWRPLDYWDQYGNPGVATVAIGDQDTEYRVPIISNLGLPIIVGDDDVPDGHGRLPGGDWQIRVRVADFGHPYPNLVNPKGAYPGVPFSSLSSENVSPWSNPVRVSVPAQVPPPIPLSPTDNVAQQEGDTIRLEWQYRNTHNPPYAQQDRWVQIRKVGDPDWSTIFAGVSGNTYVDLPPVLDNPAPAVEVEYMPDGTFEDGTTSDWFGKNQVDYDGGDHTLADSTSIDTTNVNNPSLAHSGDHFLRLDNASADNALFLYAADVDPTHDAFRLSMYFLPPPEAVSAVMSIGFWDATDTLIPWIGDQPTYITRAWDTPLGGWDWIHFEVDGLVVPPGAVKVRIVAYGWDVFASPGALTGHRIDDVSLVGYARFNLDDFVLEATTHYEWRVMVTDESGTASDYSDPARFWVVPAPDTGEVITIPDDTIDGATLGCGTHRVVIYRRGGLERVGEIRGITHLDWGRMRDDISTAKVIIEDWDIDCGNLLARLQTWAYEVVIFRDNGFTIDRVWEGPITLLTYEQDRVIINAKDVMAYPYRRIIKQRMSDAGTGNGRTVTARAAQVIQNVMAPDDPNVLAYLQVIAHDDDAMQYRSTPAYSRTAFEEVDDMAANAGLDYTAVGRAILLWSTKHRIGTLPEFRDENLGAAPIVSEYGMSMANVYSVSDGNGVYGEADRLNEDDEDPIYGLVEMLSSTWASDSEDPTGTYTETGLETIRQSFREFSERSIADRYPPPVVVRVPDNTTLNPNTVLSIQHLVPGVVIPLRSTGTLREVVGNQKLDSITVTEEKGKETITVTMSPFNRDDANAGEGTEE